MRPAVALLATALALGGCAAAPSPSATSTMPTGVTVTLTQLRSDVAARQMQVQVRNDSEAAIEVGAVSVADPRFAAPATRVVERTSSLAAGASVNVKVQLSPVQCEAPDDATPVVSLDLVADDERRSAETAVAEVFPFLEPLHARECLAEAARAAADIEFGDFTPSTAGTSAVLDLVVTPRPGRDLRVVGVRETNLITFDGYDADAEIYPIGQTPAAATTIALPLIPWRCDPHAVQEDKRGTVFALTVELDGEVATFDLAAPPELRGRLLSWVAAWCGFG